MLARRLLSRLRPVVARPVRSRRLGVEELEDRTTPAPVLLRDINAVTPAAGSSPRNLFAIGSTLYFVAATEATGFELWKSDGTAAGTVMVEDINPGGHSTPGSLTNLNGILIFHTGDPVGGREMWRSDGTPAGTFMIKDINPGALNPANPSWLVAVGGLVYFRANDGTNGYEVWKTDGTEPGTIRVSNFTPTSGRRT